jgi:methionine sulfoxide reductase heme-binding subunit
MRVRHTSITRVGVADLVVATCAAVPVLGATAVALGGAIGLIDGHRTAAGIVAFTEVPGVFLLAGVLWCTPLERLTGRSYRRRRRWLGLSFAACGVANLVAFLLEHPPADLGRPFAVAGVTAVVASIPLAVTSTGAAIRRLGIDRWRLLHRLTYVIAIAVIAHLWLVPQDDGPAGNIVATVVFAGAAAARFPPVARAIDRWRGARRLRLTPS